MVGLGVFGQHHARHLAAREDVRLVAVCDVDGDLARSTAARYDCEAATTADGLHEALDAASIAVPASAHRAVAGPLLDAGIHALIEKPLATDIADAKDLIDRAGRTGAVLQVGHIERFAPAISALSDLVKSPRRITCVRKSPWTGRSGDVDVVLDLMIHDIDHALVLAGSPVKDVAADGRVGQSGLVDEAEAWLTFENGVSATLSASRVAATSERRVSVSETDRMFVADLSQPSLSVSTRLTTADNKVVSLESNDNLRDQIASFIASASSGAPVRVDGAAGLAALEVAVKIQAMLPETTSSYPETENS